MPSLSDHQSNDFVKLCLIGDAMSGKTGSLVSLVKAGYKLFIEDYDNKLDILGMMVQRECPEMIENVQFVSLRDKRKSTPLGPVIDGPPKAFIRGTELIDHWKGKEADGTVYDFGKPKDWGSDCIFVIDSLSRMCDAAYDFREPLTPRGKGGDFDARAVYGDAQDAIESNLAHLTSENFKTNVIVVAHVLYMDMPDGSKKGYPVGVGKALSPKIPTYFPGMVYYTNVSGKRMIQTNSTPLIDLANPKPFELNKAMPIETGLATFFEACLGPGPAARAKSTTPAQATTRRSVA